jgi:TatD DNase family protein
MDLHIGVTAWICDERRGTHLCEVVKEIPPDRLMTETDVSFLLPRTITTKPNDGRNEPAFLPHVLQMVANCLGRPIAEVADMTTKTAEKFFQIRT